MAGPVPQRSAVESSSSQGPKEDLGPKGHLHTLGRGQMFFYPAAASVQRTGELVGERQWELYKKFSAGFYFPPALSQLFMEFSPLQIPRVPAVQLLLGTASSLCAVTGWPCPAAPRRTSVPSTAMPLAGLLRRWLLVFGECNMSAAVGLEPRVSLRQREHKEGVWGGVEPCVLKQIISQGLKYPTVFSLWTIHGCNRTLLRPLTHLSSCSHLMCYNSAEDPLGTQLSLRKKVCLDCQSVVGLFPLTDLSWLLPRPILWCLPPVCEYVSLIHPSIEEECP